MAQKQVASVKGTDCYPHMPILCPLATRQFVQFWASEGAKFPKMGESLNHRAKFDTASFILAGQMRNHTNTHKQ